jgi:hypothetical protein
MGSEMYVGATSIAVVARISDARYPVVVSGKPVPSPAAVNSSAVIGNRSPGAVSFRERGRAIDSKTYLPGPHTASSSGR